MYITCDTSKGTTVLLTTSDTQLAAVRNHLSHKIAPPHVCGSLPSPTILIQPSHGHAPYCINDKYEYLL